MTVSLPCAKKESPDHDEVPGKRCVLSVRGLRKAFGGQSVLDGVDIDLVEGEVVLLRGENGSGKTTLLNLLTGNLEPDAGSVHLKANGQEEIFRFPRKWWESVNPFDHFTPERVATEAVGRTWQDVRLFPTLSLLDNIAVAKQRQPGESPLRALFFQKNQSEFESVNRQAGSAILTNLNLAIRGDSSGDKVSLGQSKRIAIARSVRAGARILFLDEPLSGLDAIGVEEVLGLLSSLVRNERLTIVIIEHTFNIPRVLELATTVWSLKQGKITVESPAVVRGRYSESCGADTITWIARALGGQAPVTRVSLPGGADLWKLRAQSANVHNGQPPLFEIRDLVVRRGNRVAVGQEQDGGQARGLSFSIEIGETAILQAPNGWGKSTLAEAIVGLLPILSGQVILRGRPIGNLPVWDRINAGLQLLQSVNRGFPNLTIHQVMSLAGNSTQDDSLIKKRSHYIGELSGGEKQRLGIASIRQSSLGIYDEPFSALDDAAISNGLVTSLVSKHSALLILLPKG